MKKRLMIAAMLIGALSLSSCVENKESDSVTAVRTAKAAQLNSIAAMNNAEAECKKALAAYQKAEADIKQMEADVKKATLEMDIEAAKIKAEAALQRAKADLEAAKAQLIANMDQADAATKLRVTTLLGEADNVLNKLNNTRSNLVLEKNNLLKAKYDLVSAEAAREIAIMSAKREKAISESLIAEYEKYSKDDILNAQKNADEAEATVEGLRSVKNAKEAAYTATMDKTSEIEDSKESTLYYSALRSLGPDYFKVEIALESRKILVTFDDSSAAYAFVDGINKFVVNNDKFQEDINNASREVDINKLALKEAEKALTDKKAESGYQAKKDDKDNALKEYNEATTSSEKANKKIALEAAETALKTYTKIEEDAIEIAKMALTASENLLKNKKQQLADVSGDNEKIYLELIDKNIAALNAQADAFVEYIIAADRFSAKERLALSLRNVANSLTNYTELIQTEKDNIAKADKKIVDAETIVTQEDVIAKCEKQIEKYELDLQVYENTYASYMSQIKSLISGN